MSYTIEIHNQRTWNFNHDSRSLIKSFSSVEDFLNFYNTYRYYKVYADDHMMTEEMGETMPSDFNNLDISSVYDYYAYRKYQTDYLGSIIVIAGNIEEANKDKIYITDTIGVNFENGSVFTDIDDLYSKQEIKMSVCGEKFNIEQLIKRINDSDKAIITNINQFFILKNS